MATEAFGDSRPMLVCEPGRGLVAESMTLASRVKGVRDGSHVFLNDGVYGCMDELPLTGMIDRVAVLTPQGKRRQGALEGRIVFGPTCDSVDRLPGDIALPSEIAEGDYLLIDGMGAYSTATNTTFNGFGALVVATVLSLAI